MFALTYPCTWDQGLFCTKSPLWEEDSFCLEFEHLNFFVTEQIADKTGLGIEFEGQHFVFCIIFKLRNTLLTQEVGADVALSN